MEQRAIDYINRISQSLVTEAQLGFGTDGIVWRTTRPSAIKVFERRRNYSDELECYRRLQIAGIKELAGFTILNLEGFDDDLMIVEMSIVRPPYLLDFGKVYLDRRPPYWDDTQLMENWREEGQENFGANWPQVTSLINSLQVYGIYYVDPKPANIRFAEE